MTTAYRIAADDAREAVEPHNALRVAAGGTAVVLPGALIDLGFLPTITDLYLDEIAHVASPAIAREVQNAGLERLHDHLSGPDVAVLLTRLDARVSDLAVPLTRALVEKVMHERPGCYFICTRVWVRAQVPYRLVADEPALLASTHLTGHLLPAAPHRDFTLTHPRGTLSLFGAVGPVREGNSVALFPDWESGPTVTPALDPGDVLVFNADRLHGSVRNDTDETRVAITCRVVAGRRLRYGPGSHWRAYYDTRLLGTPFERLATLQSRMTPAAVRRWRAQRRRQRRTQ